MEQETVCEMNWLDCRSTIMASLNKTYRVLTANDSHYVPYIGIPMEEIYKVVPTRSNGKKDWVIAYSAPLQHLEVCFPDRFPKLAFAGIKMNKLVADNRFDVATKVTVDYPESELLLGKEGLDILVSEMRKIGAINIHKTEMREMDNSRLTRKVLSFTIRNDPTILSDTIYRFCNVDRAVKDAYATYQNELKLALGE